MLTAEQLIERKSGIGGSEAPAIAGISKWMTPYQLWAIKVGELERKQVPNDPDNAPAIYWGNFLEDPIGHHWSSVTGLEVRKLQKPNGKPLTLRHPDHPWMLGNLDFEVVKYGAPLEIKNYRYATGFGPTDTDQVREDVKLQGVHYAIIKGAPVAYFAILLGGSDFRKYEVPVTPELRDAVIAMEHDFWHEHVLAGVPPAPLTDEDVQLRWPAPVGALEADADTLSLLRAWRQASDDAKEADRVKEQLATRLKIAIGRHSLLVDSSGRTLATYKGQMKSSLDVDALKKDHPEIYEQYVRRSGHRVLR